MPITLQTLFNDLSDKFSVAVSYAAHSGGGLRFRFFCDWLAESEKIQFIGPWYVAFEKFTRSN